MISGSHPAIDRSRYTTLLRLANDPEVRLVVSLGGGSLPALCGNLALTRLLEELDLRERVEEIWGTSAGAAIGGAWASGTDSEKMFEVVAGLDRPGTVDIAWFRLALSFLARPFGRPLPDGLFRGKHIINAIASGLKVELIEDCPTPFRCIACTDDGRATRKVFRRGPMLRAIFHSMSLPGIVEPDPSWKDEAVGYYDGGLVEKTPLISPIAEHRRLSAEKRLVLLATHYSNETRRARARGFIGRFLQSLYALENLTWSYQLAEARAHDDVSVMILNPQMDDPAMFDFGRVRENYEHARNIFLSLLGDARIGLTFGLN
ncbi:MAG: patatin-like phospholipase family protein [Planctomycetota bacterium]